MIEDTQKEEAVVTSLGSNTSGKRIMGSPKQRGFLKSKRQKTALERASPKKEAEEGRKGTLHRADRKPPN